MIDPTAGPADPRAAWLEDRLWEQRLLLLTGFLDDPAATRAAAQLMTLDASSGERGIHLHLACPDGELGAASLLADAVELTRAPVHVRALGLVGGPALSVLAVGDSRSAAAHASFALREPRASFEGTPEWLRAQAQAHRVALDRLYARLAAVTGQTAERIAEDCRAGRHLTAWEAFDYGLLDNVEPS